MTRAMVQLVLRLVPTLMAYATLSLSLGSVLLILSLAGTVFSSIGNWAHCPENITVDGGCVDTADVTVYALFNTTDASLQCNIGYFYHVHIRRSGSGDKLDKFGPDKPIPPIVVEGTDESVCNISITDSIKRFSGSYDLQFLVTTLVPDLTSLDCEDHLFVEVPSPNITDINITCEGVELEWEEPVSVDEVLEYIITIYRDTDVVFSTSTNDTWLFIRYSTGAGGLGPREWYTVNVTATYCEGVWGSTIASFYTVTAPKLLNQIVALKNVIQNASNISVLSFIKIFNTDCKAGYPNPTHTTSVIDMNCINGYSLSNESVPIVFGSDGDIRIDLTLPFDTVCLARFTFYDETVSFKTSVDHKFTDDMNQLQSCTFVPNQNGVIVICNFADFSLLFGCQATAVGIDVNHTYTSNIIVATTLSAYGLISNIDEEGMYEMNCQGLVEYDGGTSTITYPNSTSHVSVIAVTVSPQVSVSPRVCQCNDSVVPSSEGNEECKTSLNLLLYILIPAAAIIIFVLVAIGLVVRLMRNSRQSRDIGANLTAAHRRNLNDESQSAELNDLALVNKGGSQSVDQITPIETPVDQTPVDQTPVDQTLVDQTPVDQTPVDQTPVDQTPVDQTPVDQTPVDLITPVDQTPVDRTLVDLIIPVDQTPVNQTPVDQTLVDLITPVDQTPVDQTPVDQTPVDQTPVDQTLVDLITPVDQTPVDQTLVDLITPVDQTPVDQTPVDLITPVDQTPVNQTPVDLITPVDQTPVDQTPVDQTPVDQIIQTETLVDQSSVPQTLDHETPLYEESYISKAIQEGAKIPAEDFKSDEKEVLSGHDDDPFLEIMASAHESVSDVTNDPLPQRPQQAKIELPNRSEVVMSSTLQGTPSTRTTHTVGDDSDQPLINKS